MAERLLPERSALLLLDFQRGVLAPLPHASALLDRVAAARRRAQYAGVCVCYIRTALTEADRSAIPARNKIFSRLAQSAFLAEGGETTQIAAEIAPDGGDLIVTKNRVGAFSSTNLHHMLQARSIDTLVIGGVHTSGAVLSTIRQGADLDYRVVVAADLCADPDSALHDILVSKVFSPQADIVESGSHAPLWS